MSAHDTSLKPIGGVLDTLKVPEASRPEGALGEPSQRDEAGGFILYQDEHGRSIATPSPELIAKRRAARWQRMVDESELPPLERDPEQLDPYQRRKYEELIGGAKDAVLCGPAGTGKTLVAMLAARALHDLGTTVGLVRFGRYHEMMLPAWAEQHDHDTPDRVRRRFTEPRILLIDDVGSGRERVERVSEYTSRILWELVSARCREPGRCTWITTNLGMAELERHFGEPAISRLGRRDRSVFADFANVGMNYRTGKRTEAQ